MVLSLDKFVYRGIYAMENRLQSKGARLTNVKSYIYLVFNIKIAISNFLSPSLEPISEHFSLALNEEYIERSDELITLSAGSELAVIPPISGG